MPSEEEEEADEPDQGYRRHPWQSLRCLTCNKKFPSPLALAIHPECYKKSEFYIPPNEVNKNEAEFICKVCWMNFTTHDSLHTHYEKHHLDHWDRLYECLHCHQRFGRSKTVILHLKEVHDWPKGAAKAVVTTDNTNTNAAQKTNNQDDSNNKMVLLLVPLLPPAAAPPPVPESSHSEEVMSFFRSRKKELFFPGESSSASISSSPHTSSTTATAAASSSSSSKLPVNHRHEVMEVSLTGGNAGEINQRNPNNLSLLQPQGGQVNPLKHVPGTKPQVAEEVYNNELETVSSQDLSVVEGNPSRSEASQQSNKVVATDDLLVFREGVHYKRLHYMKICSTCGVQFQDPMNFRIHMCYRRTCTLPWSERQCDMCTFKSASLTSFGCHVMSHHKEEDARYQCIPCRARFLTRSEVAKHYVGVHGKELRGNNEVGETRTKPSNKCMELAIIRPRRGRRKTTATKKIKSSPKKKCSKRKSIDDDDIVDLDSDEEDEVDTDEELAKTWEYEEEYQSLKQFYRDPCVCSFQACKRSFESNEAVILHMKYHFTKKPFNRLVPSKEEVGQMPSMCE